MPPPRPTEPGAVQSASLWQVLTRADLVLIAAVLVCIAALLSHRQGGSEMSRRLVVRAHSEAAASYSLSEPRRLRCEGPLGTSVVVIVDGAARIAASPCPQQLCVRAAWIRHAGEVVACLPNRLILQTTGEPETAGLDAVSR